MSVADQEIRTLRAQFWSARDPEGRAFAPLADAYRRKGELDEAESLVADGLARLPEFTPGHLVAGRIHRARGDLEEARASLDRVLALDEENVLALLERAELARELGDPEGAAERLRQLLSLAPAHMGARDALDRLEAAAPDHPDVETPETPEDIATAPPLDEGEADSPFSAEELVDADASFLGEEAQEDPVSAGLPEADGGGDGETGAISGDLEMFDFGLTFEKEDDAEDEPGVPVDLDSLDRGVSGLGDSLDPESEEDYLSSDLDLEGELDPGTEPELEHRAEPELEPGTEPELEHGAEPELDSRAEPVDDPEPAGAPEPVAADLAGDLEPAAHLDPGDAITEEPTEGPHATPATRTMAEIFVRQGLLDRAVDVYERLLEDAPGDEELRDRLDELREQGAAASEAPVGLPGGRTIRDHLDDLLAWVPGAVPVGDLAPDAPLDRAPAGSAAAARNAGGGDPAVVDPAPAAVDQVPPAVDPAPAAVDPAPAAGDDGASGSDGDEAGTPADPRGSDETQASDDDLDDFHTWLESLQP